MLVTCLHCKVKFDRDVEPAEKVGSRYAHKECREKFLQKEKKSETKEKKTTSTSKKNLRKCLYCQKDIDIAHEEYRMPRTNRYAHLECYNNCYNPDEDFISLIYKFLKEEVKISFDYPQCEKQRIHFVTKLGYTNEGILNALKYFYLIKKNSPEKAGNRIGIVPYVYDEAKEYYTNLKKKQKTIGKNIEKQIKEQKIEVKIKTSQYVPKKNYIDIDNI